ncbi:hypothetical protein HF521_010363 [Silurus meridionalis]|uniref:B box-type domain-containing protein n=1 Tax=Silurus meridionalis TaxID=175797 RepID=A0A8T0ALT6_SILME|nr:hypothetical protein HF521_010363 [Silurus meridionalis]
MRCANSKAVSETDRKQNGLSELHCSGRQSHLSTNFSIWRPLRLPLKCPNCRSIVELPPNGVEALPLNVCLRAIIEKYQRDNEPRAPSCPEHHRQPLNVYCVQDCKLICGLCLTIGQHQGHTIDDLQTAYVKERDAPAKLVELLTDRRWEEVCGLVEKLEQEKIRHEGLIRQDREAVTEFFHGLQRLLEHKKEAFMKVLDRANEQLACTYKPLIEKLKDMKEEQLELISIISGISDDESALVFLEKMHHLRERVSTLTQTELPEVPTLHISPRLEDFFQEYWADVTVGRLDDGPVPKISCHVKTHSTKETKPRLFQIETIRQAVTGLAHKLYLPLQDSGTFLYCLLHDLRLKLNLYLSAVGESTSQYMAFFSKTLRLW